MKFELFGYVGRVADKAVVRKEDEYHQDFLFKVSIAVIPENTRNEFVHEK